MFPLRNCVAALRAGVCAARSSLFSNSSGSVLTPPFHVRSFSSVFSNKNELSPVSPVASRSLYSTLSTLAFKNNGTLMDGSKSLLFNPSRTIMMIFWPRPRENKRRGVLGWKKRMSTPGGRRVIMRRILRGRHILSH